MDCIIEIKEPLLGILNIQIPKLIKDNLETYNYWILDPRKPGKYEYEGLNFCFLFEPFYTGISEDKNRWKEHLLNAKNNTGSNKFKNNKINKIILKTGINPYFIITNDCLTHEESCIFEKFFIKNVGRRDKNLGPLVNLTEGGDGTWGIIFSEERRKKHGDKLRGRKMSEESSRKKSENTPWKNGKRPPHSERMKGENNPLFNKKHSEESIEKNRLTNSKMKYIIIDPFGGKYEATSLNHFCEIHNLIQTSMQKVVNGKHKQHRGWTGYIIK